MTFKQKLPQNKRFLTIALVLLLALVTGGSAVLASPDEGDDDGTEREYTMLEGARRDPSAALSALDAATDGIVSSGPTAKVTKNLAPSANGDRPVAGATTDVWAYGGYAYTGTFNSPCGGDPEAGVWIWDVSNKNKVGFVGIIPSPTDSRSNDVKVDAMNSGDILVHSNEACAGGPGGFEIYNVDDPASPAHLASVQTDDINLLLRDDLGFTDFGVHNLFLFTQGDRDYVGVVVESEFGNFQIFDITDPASPSLVGFWGAEQLHLPDVTDWVNLTDFAIIVDADAYLFSGYGASQNRFLHDITISADGNEAYLGNWDAGLVLLDISDPADPQLVSVALDPANGSLDGEVNSHAAWPSEDGSIVVEGEEDFSAWEGSIPPSNLTLDSSVPGDPMIPGTAIATLAGDDFEANQTGNIGSTDGTSIDVTSGPLAGNSYPANELSTAAGSPTFADTGTLTGELVWIGQACPGDPILNAGAVDPGDIAVVRRGACFFEDKENTAVSLGASAVIISNNQASTPWSGLRIWDYSDPANPVLASTFNTTCSASTAPGGACDPAGTYSVHNVVVETKGNKVKAYISWYWDGMLVLDVTDPYNPVETARYTGSGEDYWGVYKETNSPWIYGSDRNGGLTIFKEYGAGSG
jgi:hypothetical protein